LVGFPAVSIPAPVVAAELPIGVQPFAPPGRDGVLLAGQLEGGRNLKRVEDEAWELFLALAAPAKKS